MTHSGVTSCLRSLKLNSKESGPHHDKLINAKEEESPTDEAKSKSIVRRKSNLPQVTTPHSTRLY